MIILQILGWVIFVFLAISIIYSAQYHLRNYLRQKKRINSGEVGEIYKNLHGEMNWGRLFLMQIVKLFIALILLTWLLS